MDREAAGEECGRRVVVTLDGGEYVGRVIEESYVPGSGTPLVAVALEEPSPDGARRLVVEAEQVERG